MMEALWESVFLHLQITADILNPNSSFHAKMQYIILSLFCFLKIQSFKLN